MLRTGELRVRRRTDDTLLPGRVHERADQFYRGVRVFGADVARQLRNGATESVFGTLYEGIGIDTSPDIVAGEARELLAARLGVEIDASIAPELVILPRDDGSFVLTWRMRVAMRRDTRQYFVDAHSGATVFNYSDRETQSAVGKATQDLQTTLENKSATPEEIAAKLKAVREARAKAKEQVTAAQKDLKEVLTQRQEAVLVNMGWLE